MKALGSHLLIELYDCDTSLIGDRKYVEEILKESVKVSGATMVQSVFHEFNPIGVSGVIVIAESHFSIHTWPEYGYCAVDIFTCGDKIDMQKALQAIKIGFKSDNVSVFEAQRGTLPLPPEQIKHKVEAQ